MIAARRDGWKAGQMFADFWNSVKDPELRMAWAVAVAADALQIGALPLFAEGVPSPAGQCAGSGRGVYADPTGRLALGVLADDRCRGAAGCRPVPYLDGGVAVRFA